MTNPKVVFEVLSDSTADYDRGEKLQHYQQIGSLEAVVLVDARAARIDCWMRNQAGWLCQAFGPGNTVQLPAIGCVIVVDDILNAAREA